MKFKILPGTKLYDRLWSVNTGIIAARATIADTLKSMGFIGLYATSSGTHIVSCDAVEIFGEKPDGWKSVGDKYQCLYYPKVSNKKDSKIIAALPRIKNEAINEPLGFGFNIGPNLEVYYRPGIAFHKKYILVDIGNSEYKKKPDMIEILESEYNKLHKAIKD